jgi:hypothetical protein
LAATRKAQGDKCDPEQLERGGFGHFFDPWLGGIADDRVRGGSRVYSIPEEVLRRITRDELNTGVGLLAKGDDTSSKPKASNNFTSGAAARMNADAEALK